MKKIEEIYVFVNEETVENEGICNETLTNNDLTVIFPMICSNIVPELLEKIKKSARKFSKEKKAKVKLLKFTCREELEIIDERN